MITHSIRSIIFAFTIFVAMPVQAQSANSALGRWQNTQLGFDSFTISKDGDVFLLRDNEGQVVPGRIKDGQIVFDSRIGPAPLTYLKSNDTILLGGQSYKRLK